jgi:hypothetical protein
MVKTFPFNNHNTGVHLLFTLKVTWLEQFHACFFGQGESAHTFVLTVKTQKLEIV